MFVANLNRIIVICAVYKIIKIAHLYSMAYVKLFLWMGKILCLNKIPRWASYHAVGISEGEVVGLKILSFPVTCNQ